MGAPQKDSPRCRRNCFIILIGICILATFLYMLLKEMQLVAEPVAASTSFRSGGVQLDLTLITGLNSLFVALPANMLAFKLKTLKCDMDAQTWDFRPGYLRRSGESHHLLELTASGFPLAIGPPRMGISSIRIHDVDFPSLRDFLWAVAAMKLGGEEGIDVLLGYKCRVEVRVVL